MAKGINVSQVSHYMEKDQTQKRVDLIKEYGDNARLNVDTRTETIITIMLINNSQGYI